MKMIKNNNRKSFLKNNDGVALVSVMVVMTVCLLVATIVLELTYTSLLSRRVNKLSNKNFYEAESVVDNLQSVLQTIAVYSTQELKNSSGEEFVDIAHDTLYASSGADQYTDVNVQNAEISKYLFNNMSADYQKILGTASVDVNGNPVDADGDGNQDYVYNGNKFWVETVTKKDGDSSGASKGALTLSIHLSYENENGFLTNISTDLVMNDVTTRTPASAYSLGSYSMFTGGGVSVEGNIGYQNKAHSIFLQEGNAYVGTMQNSSTAMTISNTIVGFEGDRVIINGDVYVTNEGGLWFVGDKTQNPDGTYTYPQIDIRGTLYIDSTSFVMINEGIDLMLEDIVLVNGSEKWSVFENGKASYISAGDVVEFPSYVPFNTTNINDVKEHRDGSDESNWINQDFYANSQKVGGCIFYKQGDVARIIEYNHSSDSWQVKGSTQSVNTTINYESTFLPQAKTTVWTYDGKQITVDAELARFVNIPLLYWQDKNAGTDILTKDSCFYLPASMRGEIKTTSFNLGKGGNDCKSLYYIDGVTTGSLTDKSSKATTLETPFEMNGMQFTQAKFGIGQSGAYDNLNEGGQGYLAMYCGYGSYIVQFNSSYYIGTLISADKCTYKPMGHGCSIGYSILAAEELDPVGYTSLKNWIESLHYVNFIKDNASSYFTNSSVYDYGYSLFSLDSLFVGGLDSFLDSNSGQSSGDGISLNVTNVYDFISTQNWQTY